MKGNQPLFTFLTAVVMMVAGACVLIFAPFDTAHNADLAIFFGMMSSAVPALVSSFFAERGSKDIRNGVVVDKAQQGAAQALEETGLVTHVQTQSEAQQAATAALITLLKDRMAQEDTPPPRARKSSGQA